MDKRPVAFAALASAGLASICCLGPLIATALGVGGLGLAAGLTKYRPFFLTMTGVVLAAAFYRAFWKRSPVCADGGCGARGGSRAMKTSVWTLAALSAVLASFPRWSGRLSAGPPAAIPTGARRLALNISGMTCEACGVAIKQSIEKVPGVLSAEIEFHKQQAVVVLNGEADPAAVIRAVAAAGYKAELLKRGGHG